MRVQFPFPSPLHFMEHHDELGAPAAQTNGNGKTLPQKLQELLGRETPVVGKEFVDLTEVIDGKTKINQKAVEALLAQTAGTDA